MKQQLSTIPASAWGKSSYSGSGSGSDCVELAALPGHRAVRDSKNPAPRFAVSDKAMGAFLAFAAKQAI